jgi:uncharacterized protein (TIGR03086 family)
MTDTAAERFRRVDGTFTQRIREVPSDAWENPAPCDGWVARDVVRHLLEWVPWVIGRSGIEFRPGPSVYDDPYGAWRNLADTLQSCLDDPAIAAQTFDAGPPGRMSVEDAIDSLVTADVLLHTWDLAVATGLDPTLDREMVVETLHRMEPMDETLRASGHFGPKVAAAPDADDQAKLIAFTGRDPNWH